MLTSEELRQESDKLDAAIAKAQELVDSLSAGLDAAAFEANREGYDDLRERLESAQDGLDLLIRKQRGLSVAMQRAKDAENQADIAAARGKVDAARQEVKLAAADWDAALAMLESSYARIKEAWHGSLDDARKVGLMGGICKVDGAPYMDGLHRALSVMVGGSPLPGGYSGSRNDTRGLGAKLGLE